MPEGFALQVDKEILKVRTWVAMLQHVLAPSMFQRRAVIFADSAGSEGNAHIANKAALYSVLHAVRK